LLFYVCYYYFLVYFLFLIYIFLFSIIIKLWHYYKRFDIISKTITTCLLLHCIPSYFVWNLYTFFYILYNKMKIIVKKMSVVSLVICLLVVFGFFGLLVYVSILTTTTYTCTGSIQICGNVPLLDLENLWFFWRSEIQLGRQSQWLILSGWFSNYEQKV
jgi:hypothetical protein